MRITVPIEAQIWQLALGHFDAHGLTQRLRHAKQTFQRRRQIDFYGLMPVEQFGIKVLGVIHETSELAQLDVDGRLLMPSQLRRHLLNMLLQVVPVERLGEPLLELRLRLDLGL